MSSEHYFSQSPASGLENHQIPVELAGRKLMVQTSSGTFSTSRLDPGTAILLKHLDLAAKDGLALDLGCGWGPIALALALKSPKLKIWAVDVNERSIALTKKNASEQQLVNIAVGKPEEIDTEITFNQIWSNPPIRIGKKALHDLLLQWLTRLKVGGEAFLVVQKHLGSDSLQRWLSVTLGKNFETSRIDSDRGYRVLRVERLAG